MPGRQVIDSQPLTEVATLERCSRCSAVVLAGHAEGVLAAVDLVAVDVVGELAAMLLGRWTYDVIPRRLGRGAMLAARQLGQVASERRWPVAVEHRCPSVLGRQRRSERRGEPDPALAWPLLGRPPAVEDLVDPPF